MTPLSHGSTGEAIRPGIAGHGVPDRSNSGYRTARGRRTIMIPNELWRMLGVECVVNSPPGRDPALLLKQEGAQCSAWI